MRRASRSRSSPSPRSAAWSRIAARLRAASSCRIPCSGARSSQQVAKVSPRAPHRLHRRARSRRRSGSGCAASRASRSRAASTRIHSAQSGDALLQKLIKHRRSASMRRRSSLSPMVTGRARAAFDVERVTKRFYDRFQKEHTAFLKLHRGHPRRGRTASGTPR